MKVSDLEALAGSLSGDFKSIEPHLLALDKHLVLRTYLDGYTLSAVDTRVWGALRNNKAAPASIKRGSLLNLQRWYIFIEQTHPEIQEDAQAKDAAAKAKIVAGSKAGGNFNLALQHPEKGVVTRFLPEPSGYLHIGHAKAALLSDYFARAYDGKLRLRLDDTNPSNEKEEFQDAIIEDLNLMGITADVMTFTSDYFDHLYEMCVRLIKEGHAYADDTDQETMRAERMDGIASKHRNMSVEETLRIFEEMKAGSADGQRFCIRARISADDPNKALRDPVIYRCNVATPHHRTGTKWKIYPMYDLACPVVDSYEGVTHALRSTEYTDRNPLYQWFLETLGLRKVYMWDFARINFVRTFLSKRKLTKLVDAGSVWGWDDPRMPTIRGIRRRGMTVPALREFILKQGPSRNVVNMDWTTFWATNKKYIDPVAPRHTAIAAKHVVTVSLTGKDAPAEPHAVKKPKHPKNPDVGTKSVVFSSTVVLDQVDVKSFKPDEEFTLMAWGNAIVRKIDSGPDGTVSSLTCELHLDGDFRKTEKKITWLAKDGQQLVPAEAWDFDHLLTKDKLEEGDNFEDFLNPVTSSLEDMYLGADAKDLKADDIIQLERRGYYRVDKGLNDWMDGEAGEKGPRIVLFLIPVGRASNVQAR